MNINKNPNIKVYHLNAFAQCIIANHKSYLDWHYNNYIQLFGWFLNGGKREHDNCVLAYLTGNIYGYVPLLSYENFSERFVETKKEDVLPLIRENMEDDIVWYLFLDQFYTKEELAYQNRHYIRDVLVHNDNGKYFEYVQFDNGFYSNHKADEVSFLEALTCHDANCLYRIKLNHDMTYRFQLPVLIEMLKDYTFSRDSRERIDMYFKKDLFHSDALFGFQEEFDYYFGMDVYQMLIKKMEYSIKTKESLDGDLFHVMYEHKMHLIHTIQYCKENGYLEGRFADSLISRFKELAERLYGILYQVMQRDFTLKARNLIAVIGEFKDIARKEKVLLVELISGLETN